VAGLPYRRPTDGDLRGFIDTLREGGVSVQVRRRKRADIDAACGQLRRETEARVPTREPEPALPTPAL